MLSLPLTSVPPAGNVFNLFSVFTLNQLIHISLGCNCEADVFVVCKLTHPKLSLQTW